MENLRKIRKERDLTMKEVGIAIGVGESTISQYRSTNFVKTCRLFRSKCGLPVGA